jgi:hypothetical protein
MVAAMPPSGSTKRATNSAGSLGAKLQGAYNSSRRDVAAAVDRPLFIVGCGRSGTTLVYDLLSGHPDLGWFSTYTDHWPAVPQLAAVSRLHPLLHRHGWLRRGTPRPSEGYRLWDHFLALDPLLRDGPLDATDSTPEQRGRMSRVIRAHLRYQGRARFINKNTRNARRVAHVSALFPDARFIHVIRNPHATVSSLLQVAFWPDLRLYWRGGRTTADLVAAGARSEELAAELWCNDVDSARRDGALLGPERYLEVRYELLLRDPHLELSRILDFAGLRWKPGFERFVGEFSIATDADARAPRLTPEQLLVIDRVTAPVATPLGYARAS